MKIDFSGQFKKLDGTPMTVQETDGNTGITNDTGKPFDLKHAATQALLGQLQGEKPDGMKSYKRYKLAEKINESESAEVDLSVEEIADIKKRIGEMYNPIIVGQAWDILDPPKEEGKKGGKKK